MVNVKAVQIISDGPTEGNKTHSVWLRIAAFISLKAPNTQVTYSGIINEFCRFLGVQVGSEAAAKAIISLTDLHVAAYRRWLDQRPGETPRGMQPVESSERSIRTKRYKAEKKSGHEATLSNATIAKKFAALRRIYRVLLSQDLGLRSNPFSSDSVPVPAKDSGRKRPTEMVDYELVRQIISAPDMENAKGLRDHAILSLLFGAGLRRSELVSLKLGDVRKTRRGTSFVYLRATKARRDAEQAVPDWAAKALWQFVAWRKKNKATDHNYLFISFSGRGGLTPQEQPISASGIYKLFKHYCQKCGASLWATPHSARATAITRLLDSGLSHREVRAFSRHASIQMVELYDKRRISTDENPAKDLNFDS